MTAVAVFRMWMGVGEVGHLVRDLEVLLCPFPLGNKSSPVKWTKSKSSIASQCLSPPCALFFMWNFDNQKTRAFKKNVSGKIDLSRKVRLIWSVFKFRPCWWSKQPSVIAWHFRGDTDVHMCKVITTPRGQCWRVFILLLANHWMPIMT